MTCAICGQSHAADAPCETLVKERHSTGTRVLASSPSGSAPLIASPAPMPSAFTPGPARTPMGTPLPPAPAVDPLLGTTIGSFRIVKFLGKGGMGTVYLGEQTVIGSKVAIKFLHEHLASSPSLVSRFYAEARAVNLIGHENIVNIFDMNVVPPSRYYLIMEYLDGRPLNGLVKGPVPPEVTIPILIQVCDALDAAHQNGVVHRDLKPENIFVIKRGRNEHFVKVLDFGIAKLFATEAGGEQTSVGTIVGTPEYMAPEQANGEVVDGRSDLYALGIIAYLMACGRLPFYGGGLTGLLMAHREKIPEVPHLLNPALPRAFSDVITKAIAKKPNDRFQTAAAFGRALEAVLDALPKKATSPSGAFPIAGPAPEAQERGAPTPVRVPAAGVPPAPAPKAEASDDEGAFAWAGAVSIPTPARAPTPAPKAVVAVPWPSAASTPRPSSTTPSSGSGPSAPAPFTWPTAAGAYPASGSASTPSPRGAGPATPAPPGRVPTPVPVAPAAAPIVTAPVGRAPTPAPVPPTPAAGVAAAQLTPRPLAPTPAPTHPRHAATFDATVVTAEGTSIGTLKCQDISKGGAFLCTQGKLPAVFSRVKLKLPVAGDFEAVAEVVRHVTPEQAAAWGMLPGFGVQFLGLTPEQRDALGRVVQGLPAQQAAPPPRSDRDDPTANATIAAYTKRINGDHYVVLGLLADAEFSELRARGRDARKELEALKVRPISAQQRAQIDTALQKIQAAVDCIGTASARLEYDANRANFRGVARCIAAGLTVTEIEAARKKFLAAHSGAETNAHVKFVTGKAWESKAAYSQAIDLYEQALQLDPLNLAVQQRYWALKRRPQP